MLLLNCGPCTHVVELPRHEAAVMIIIGLLTFISQQKGSIFQLLIKSHYALERIINYYYHVREAKSERYISKELSW